MPGNVLDEKDSKMIRIQSLLSKVSHPIREDNH